ncbi:hypothetical protein B9Z65_1863 [Elsinoe australis]|uniref:AAA+ ATPase domain-containing protein n=1 Tax=Elsinoe australis TaxID=40998 RepID=A0A2P7YL44_9PEZI|nr:hypothetical protein B9Z65_1863 [Elsinoe australis]
MQKPDIRTYLEAQGSLLEFPYLHAESQVMIDSEAYSHETWNDRSSDLSLGRNKIEDDCDCTECSASRRLIKNDLDGYDNISKGQIHSLSSHQYFLCPQSIPVFSFKAREWQLVDVSNLSPATFSQDMIGTLVMDESRIRMLKGLAQNFTKENLDDIAPKPLHWSADFVAGKGSSRIFLLHGPPGVGKTYTAECIAEFTNRPLMTLTCSDIGTDPVEVERALEKSFKRAKAWGAILVIDEADVYLERRSQTDLTRNSLVTAFLRAMEFYEGILFLTTNRVGAFDDAFVSRIQVTLRYRPLGPEERLKIWDNFLTKLKRERHDRIRVMDREVEKYLRSDEVRKIPLNGREIRNIVQTAVGLAEYEGDIYLDKILLKQDHIAQVIDMTVDFKHYMSDILSGNEEVVAQRRFLRAEADPASEEL